MSEKTFTNFKLLSSQPKFVCLYFFISTFLIYTFLFSSTTYTLLFSFVSNCVSLSSFLHSWRLDICFLCILYKNKTLRSSEGLHSYTQFLLLVFFFLFFFFFLFSLLFFLIFICSFTFWLMTNGIILLFPLYPGRLRYKCFDEE